MKPVEFHPDAAEEARAAAAHYEGIRGGFGADFQAELDAALTRIRGNPELYTAESLSCGWGRWAKPFRPPAELPRDRGIALHAHGVTFLHPIHYEPITVTTPLPESLGA
jgi:hypothetical protein